MVENLIINRVVLHQIFIRNDNKSIKQPKYNDTLTQMDNTSSFIFSQRVVQAIGNESHCIEMEIYKSDESSTFKNLIDLIDKDDETFIDLSKKIAYKLAESQTSKKIPGGTVVIFEGTVGNDEKKFIAVMKAEYQSGFQLNTSSNGLSLDFIKNLILTPHQKFYKIGFFIENESNKTDYIALVYDNNLSKGSSSEAAQYFYDEFLGCKFKQTDKHLTKKFYIHTKEFINNLIDLTETEKIDLNYALYSYVKLNQTNMISTKNFADTYMKDKFKDQYTGYMEENDFPERNIFKDISLISSDLKKRKIKFNNNINLTAPSDKFKDYIKFEENDADDITIIKIKGKILSQQ